VTTIGVLVIGDYSLVGDGLLVMMTLMTMMTVTIIVVGSEGEKRSGEAVTVTVMTYRLM